MDKRHGEVFFKGNIEISPTGILHEVVFLPGTEGSFLRVHRVTSLKSAHGPVVQHCFGNYLKGVVHLILLELWKKFSEVRFNYFKAVRDLKKSCSSVVPQPLALTPSFFY